MVLDEIQLFITRHIPAVTKNTILVPASLSYVAASDIYSPIDIPAYNQKSGQLLIAEGTVLQPSVVGFLTAIGVKEVEVFEKPKIALLSVNFENLEITTKDTIYPWGFSMVKAAIDEMQIHPIFIRQLKNQRDIIKTVMRHTFRYANMVFMTETHPTGRRIQAFLEEEGVETLYAEKGRRSGKLVYLGKKEETLVFVFPPSLKEAFSCFYRYARPAIRLFMGYTDVFLEKPYLKNPVFPRSTPLIH